MLWQREKSEVMLVALEYGGQWRPDLAPRSEADLIMVIQVAGEDPLQFARRFLDKVLTLIARGSEVTSAVMAVAPTIDARRLEARCAIARTLLRVFRPGSQGQLCLIEPSKAPADCRAHLLAIAEGLSESSLTDCEIRVGHDTFRSASTGTGAARVNG